MPCHNHRYLILHNVYLVVYIVLWLLTIIILLFSFSFPKGAVGYDFSSFSSPSQLEEGFSKVSKLLLQHGVTGYCPTVVTSSRDYYKKVCLCYMRATPTIVNASFYH